MSLPLVFQSNAFDFDTALFDRIRIDLPELFVDTCVYELFIYRILRTSVCVSMVYVYGTQQSKWIIASVPVPVCWFDASALEQWLSSRTDM